MSNYTKCEMDVINAVFAIRKAWWFGPDGHDCPSNDGRTWIVRYSEDNPVTMLESGHNDCLERSLIQYRTGQLITHLRQSDGQSGSS